MEREINCKSNLSFRFSKAPSDASLGNAVPPLQGGSFTPSPLFPDLLYPLLSPHLPDGSVCLKHNRKTKMRSSTPSGHPLLTPRTQAAVLTAADHVPRGHRPTGHPCSSPALLAVLPTAPLIIHSPSCRSFTWDAKNRHLTQEVTPR